jgi:hypothetical protein
VAYTGFLDPDKFLHDHLSGSSRFQLPVRDIKFAMSWDQQAYRYECVVFKFGSITDEGCIIALGTQTLNPQHQLRHRLPEIFRVQPFRHLEPKLLRLMTIQGGHQHLQRSIRSSMQLLVASPAQAATLPIYQRRGHRRPPVKTDPFQAQ